MALTAKEVTEVDQELREFMDTMPMAGIRALYIHAGQAGYAAMDGFILTEWSKVSDERFNETPPTTGP